MKHHLAFVLFFAAACRDSSSSPSFVAPPVTDLGLATGFLQHDGDLWGIVVSEAQQGNTDLNSDGDALDFVLHTLDLATGALVNRELALGGGLPCCVPFLTLHGSLVLFGVSEADQGGTDLDGDGDAFDTVLHVIDTRTGTTTNVDLAADPAGVEANVLVDDDFVGFLVSEQAQGEQDLDGDGSTVGEVLHVYDARTRTTTNVGRSRSGPLAVHDAVFAYTVSETLLHDLTGDGDELDGYVQEVYDARTGTRTNLRLATEGLEPLFAGGDWLFLVSEIEQGTDMNGDGDARDGVYFTYDPRLGALTPLDLGDSWVYPLNAEAGDEQVALTLNENGVDHNGDGDGVDYYMVVLDPLTGSAFDTHQAVDPDTSGPSPSWLGHELGFLVSESAQGFSDLNGDGDQVDYVAHVLDTHSGRITNLRQDAAIIQAAGGRLQLTRFEIEAGVDWNRDGDRFDRVLFLWDPRGGTSNTHIASSFVALDATADLVLLDVDENDEGRDLNQDGDRFDDVYVLHDAHTHLNASLGLALGIVGAGGGLSPAGRGLFSVYEPAQGTDLNGDGDMDDAVLHVIP